MALSGYINCFVESLTKNEFKRLLMILFLFFSVLPMMGSATETALLKSGQCVTYFIYAYLIGRYIRLHRDIDVPKAKSVLMTLVFIAMLFTIKVAGMYVSAIDAIPVMSNNSPLILGAVVSVFYLFKSFNFKSKIVNKILPQVKDAGLSYFFRIQIWKPSFSHVFLYKFRKRYMANFRRIVEYAEAKYERERKNEIAMEGVIPPVEYAEIMRHTACVLDTDRGSQSGITPRVIWALAMGKKIISTNRNLLRAPFYSPEQIFIIDRESPVIDIDFIKDNRTFSIHPEIEKARLDKWVKNFIED